MSSIPESDREASSEEPYSQPPVTVAGGWQGVNLAGPSGQEEVGEPKLPGKDTCFSRWALQYPRLFHIMLQIVLPLLFLIGLAFLCGYLLALFESGEEKRANDEALSTVVDSSIRIRLLAELAGETPRLCLESYEGDTANSTALAQHMNECGTTISEELSGILDEFVEQLTEVAYSSITFNWISCRQGLDKYADRLEQAKLVIGEWLADFASLREMYEARNISLADALERAREEASGHDSCDVSVAGGAIFWFTIMSTIGYGNTAPVSTGGRTLVYTLGFVSILTFTALIGQAGYICLVVVDDIFIRRNLKWLTRGVAACIFWAGCCGVWMVAIAAVAYRWGQVRPLGGESNENFRDAYWFSYISTTTVGLGDIFIPHDRFRWEDMFYFPPMFLVGFVLLANFLLKLSTVLTSQGVSHDRSLDRILEQSRRRHVRMDESERLPGKTSMAGDKPDDNHISKSVGVAMPAGGLSESEE